MSPRVLIADDDAGVRYTLEEIFTGAGHDVVAVKDGEAALARATEERFDLIVTDLRMPKLDGLGLLEGLALRGLGRDTGGPPVVLITAHGSERHAVEAMKRGAYDYFHKPFEVDELLQVAARALESSRLAAENTRLGAELNLSRSLLYASPSMSRLAELVARVAPRDVTVLVIGESGTGKERIAEAIVRASRRAARPFVRFNCASLTQELAEAELFGHTRGAFTGADRARPGLFREADGGTLFLDELGELDLHVQAKLLRVLQSGEVRPVGDDRTHRVDVRIIGATHRDIAQMVKEGKFREDLHYRLKIVELFVPPLRERAEDIPLLANEFLRRAAARFGVPRPALGPTLADALLRRAWPGNVRELEHAIESLVAMSADGELDLSLLDERPTTPGDPGEDAPLRDRVEAYERTLVSQALARAGGNRSEAARALRIGRATLHEKMAKYRID